MNYDTPFYRRSPSSILNQYTTRLLVMLLGVLGGVGLLVNLPLPYSTPQIGWTTQRSSDLIALHELSAEDATQDEPTKEVADQAEGPPPTRHASPSPNGAQNPTEGSTADRASETSTDSTKLSSSPRRLAALTTQDRHPQIKGGSGALYLHIQYPEAARRQGIEGRLELEFTVTREGEVQAIEVARSLHPLCDSAAVRALRSVEFRPAIHRGQRIPVRMTLPIRFQIRPNGNRPLHTQRHRSSTP